MGYGEEKQAECRMYTAVWAFIFVSIATVITAMISMSETVPATAAFTCAAVVAIVGYPCAVLAAWGDCVNKVIDSVLGLFKRKEKAE